MLLYKAVVGTKHVKHLGPAWYKYIIIRSSSSIRIIIYNYYYSSVPWCLGAFPPLLPPGFPGIIHTNNDF